MVQRRSDLISLLSIAAFLLVFFIIFEVRIKIQTYSSKTSVRLHKSSSHGHGNFSLLIGVFTLPDKYYHRNFLRLIYGIQKSPIAKIDINFIFCNLTKPEQKFLISLEILRYNDIIILDCMENMDKGKTYTYFLSLPQILSISYDYVMKADDDVFIRLHPLTLSLNNLPRLDMYYGFVIPCNSMNPYVDYMSGMGFLLSWDIVEWIAKSNIPLNYTFGPEDKLVGLWLKRGSKAKKRYSDKPAMYDYPGTNGRCSHELIPDTVAVHRLKRWDQWLNVLKYFNVTKGLKPSKLYHV